MIDKICPQCHKAFQVPPKHKNQTFCSQQCFGISKRKTIYTNCPECGKGISGVTWENKKFCSSVCANRHNNKPSISKKTTFVCETCGGSFIDWTYRKTRFCSVQCGNEWKARRPKPAARKPENIIHAACEYCNNSFEFHKSLIETSGRNPRFCSAKCKYDWMSENMRGENNPNWVEGESAEYRGPNWAKQARSTRRRDKDTCQHCGRQQKDGKKWEFGVHHIIPYRCFGGDYKKANHLSNLVLLCRSCHAKADAKIRQRERVTRTCQ